MLAEKESPLGVSIMGSVTQMEAVVHIYQLVHYRIIQRAQQMIEANYPGRA